MRGRPGLRWSTVAGMTLPAGAPAVPTVIEGARLPILSWAADAEETAFVQARNLANLEVARDISRSCPTPTAASACRSVACS